MKRFDTVIFDFDYTLADSSAGVCQCVNYALKSLGYPEAGHKDICCTIGLHLTETFALLSGEKDEKLAEAFREYFKEKADMVMKDGTSIFGYVGETLDILRRHGMKTGIVSTKFRYRIIDILERDNMAGFFDIVVGGEDVVKHKPDPEGLLTAIGKLCKDRSGCLYVGDSITDARAAEAAGTAFVAVLSGVTPASAFAGYPAEAVLDNISFLPGWLGF